MSYPTEQILQNLMRIADALEKIAKKGQPAQEGLHQQSYQRCSICGANHGGLMCPTLQPRAVFGENK